MFDKLNIRLINQSSLAPTRAAPPSSTPTLVRANDRHLLVDIEQSWFFLNIYVFADRIFLQIVMLFVYPFISKL